MELKLTSVDRIQLSTYGGKNFVEVNGMVNEAGIQIIGCPTVHYIEVRKKAGQIATFYFNGKRWKKDTDLGWWADAEVVFALNNVIHN
jgi:hypothetical protein